jgi:hypothetical protein
MNRSLRFLLCLLLVTFVGCQRGNEPKYANVKGKVTYNGSPIEKGEISFAMGGQPPSTMKIVDGEFNGQAMIGSNTISVNAWKKSPTAPKPSAAANIQIQGYLEKFKHAPNEGGPSVEYDPTLVNYIPPEWGIQSKETRVVESGSANEFEFNITGKD